MHLVQVIERDRVRPQPAEALLDLLSQHVGPAFARLVTALRRDDAVTHDPRLTDRRLALTAAVQMRRVDEPDARGNRLLDKTDARRPEPIRAHTDPRYLDARQRDLALHALTIVGLLGEPEAPPGGATALQRPAAGERLADAEPEALGQLGNGLGLEG
jgi:hypothetical protein